MSRRRSRVRQTFTLSFLDVLCCSLGATVVLFLGFVSATGSDSAPGGLLNNQFVDFEFLVAADALLQLSIETPRGERYDVRSQDLDGGGFIVKASRSWTAARVLGAGTSSTLTMEGRRVYKVMIFDPAPGAWKVNARYVDRIDEQSLLQPLAPARIMRRVSASNIRPLLATSDVSFGAMTSLPSFIVSGEAETRPAR